MNQGMTCTDGRCREIMALAARGKQNFVCQHLSRAINTSSYVEESLYPPIEQASLSTTMKVQVQNLKSKADQHQSPLLVKWPYSVSPTFYSVYTGNVKQWCQLGRVLLTVTKDTINCPCVGSTHNCVHKASVRWVIQCKQKSDAVTPEDDVSQTGDCPNVSKETIAKRTRDWIEYLCKKRYDPESFVDFDASVEFTSLIPSENDCPQCDNALAVKLSTDKGVVVDYQFIRKDIKVFKKDCQRCGNFVYYHDPSHGLHNYKNKIFLTMRFCRWIRCCIQTHTALGRELDKLQLFNKLSYPPHNEIMKAYLSYEALCAHDYEFICLECGIFPPVLVTDVDKKCCFKLNLADVGGQEDATDTVCQDSFWDRVDMQIMSAASSDDASTEHVVPSYNNWSPYVGAAKSDQMVYNTEFKKLPASSRPTNHDEEMELELTEDLLIELMSKKKMADIKQVCRVIGESDRGTKLECLERIRVKLADQSSFNKVFTKFQGCSGGLLAACCPHGITYGIKFLLRGESPRDHVDMILSLAHQPTVCVCDIPWFVATHGNKRKPGMFQPHQGRFADASAENLQLLRNSALNIEIPELDISKLEFNVTSVDHTYDNNMHPLTNTSNHYCAFDRFHQSNTASEIEQLRRLDLVKEFRGVINSQVVEELFSYVEKSIYFLNQCKAVHHIFLVKLMIHLLNKKRNQERLSRIEKRVKEYFPGCSLEYGSDKRIVICPSKQSTTETDQKTSFKTPVTTEVDQKTSVKTPVTTEANQRTSVKTPITAPLTQGSKNDHDIVTPGTTSIQPTKKKKHVHFADTAPGIPMVWEICSAAPDDRVLARHGSYSLTSLDFLSLKGTAWLTDQVVDAYLHLLVTKWAKEPAYHLPTQTVTSILDRIRVPLLHKEIHG